MIRRRPRDVLDGIIKLTAFRVLIMENLNEKQDENISMEHVVKSTMEVIKPNTILRGEVVTVDGEFAYVNVGTKSDGRVRLSEFREKPRIGESIDIMLVNPRMVDGMYLFSTESATREKGWRKFLLVYRSGASTVSGRLTGTSAKGMTVDCDGISAFLPYSQAADMKMRKPSADEINIFKIKSVDEKKRSVILSRREYIEEERQRVWATLSTQYKEGDRIRGRVTRFVDFGAFVDVGGVEGLLHKNDISWKRVFKKKNILKIGEEREFVVLGINLEEGKISLGLKQLTEDPWLTVGERYPEGSVAEGRVVTITGHGAFVELEDGVEGFLDAREISWTKKAVMVQDVLKKGQTVAVKILGAHPGERRLLVGMRQLLPNPWDSIDERFPVGSVHRRPVKKVVSFGMFVELENDIDGLIHVSDISWDESAKGAPPRYAEGEEVEFKILEIRKGEMRISCGIKQLTRSPWDALKEKYPPRSRVSGVISGIVAFGIFVKLEDDIEGLVHISEVSRKKTERIEERFSVGDRVDAVVLGVDAERKRLSLSIKQYDIITEKEELSRVLNNNSPARVTIGDIIKMKQGE